VAIEEDYLVKVTNIFAALESLDDCDGDDNDDVDVDIGRSWEIIRGNMKALGTKSVDYCELKQRFPEECSRLSDEKKLAKLQWLQNPSETNGDNLKNVRRETS
jgi:hypothetical protein